MQKKKPKGNRGLTEPPKDANLSDRAKRGYGKGGRDKKKTKDMLERRKDGGIRGMQQAAQLRDVFTDGGMMEGGRRQREREIKSLTGLVRPIRRQLRLEVRRMREDRKRLHPHHRQREVCVYRKARMQRAKYM